jgi:t-SNARE complex subunit (syntaxin)
MGLTAQTECKEGVSTAENAVLAGTFLANTCLENIVVAIIIIIIIIIHVLLVLVLSLYMWLYVLYTFV